MLMSPTDFAHYANEGITFAGVWDSLKWIGIPATCLLTIAVSFFQAIVHRVDRQQQVTSAQAGIAVVVYILTAPLLALGLTKAGWLGYALNATLSNNQLEYVHNFIMSSSLLGLLIRFAEGG